MITFTKEQLIASAHARIEFAEMMLAGELEPLKERTWSIEMELARIALASLEAEKIAEPVAKVETVGVCWYADNGVPRKPAVGTELYSAPPAPLSVPDFGALTKSIVQRLVDYGAADDDAIASAEEFVYNACRAAMLQSFGNSEQLNSPVIPDGWKLVPIELTGDMTNAMSEAILDDLHNVDVWRSVLAAAPQQEVK
ncbi:hypothetical protein ACV6SP_004339 [Enterobacter hormaechei]